MDTPTHIIVGCGAAGSCLAARLARTPRNRILVLELGPDNYGNPIIETPADAASLWGGISPRPSPTALKFHTTVQTERRYRYPRGAGPGGSTNHHSMIDGRGSLAIYDGIAKLTGDARWSGANVTRYFDEMDRTWLTLRPATIKSQIHHDYLAVAHDLTKTPYGFDPYSGDGLGRAVLQITPEGKRCNSYSNLLHPLMQRQNNVKVLFNTLVTRVVFVDNRAVGVEVLCGSNVYLADHSAKVGPGSPNDGKRLIYYASDKVILCGGSINSPQLLLLSGVGATEHLAAYGIETIINSPHVGQHLMDHHECGVTFDVDPQRYVFPGQAYDILQNLTKAGINDPTFVKFLQQFADKQEALEGSGGTFLETYSGLPTTIGHDLHIHEDQGFWFDFDADSVSPLPDGKIRADYYKAQTDPYHPDFLRVFHAFLVEVLVLTKTTGSIQLASADARVPPRIDLGLDKDTEACERMAHGIQLIRKIVNDPRLSEYYLKEAGRVKEVFPGSQYETIDQLVGYLKQYTSIGHHISGTCAMTKVVDSSLKVIGTDNLYVVDCSVYPAPFIHAYNTAKAALLCGTMAADLWRDV